MLLIKSTALTFFRVDDEENLWIWPKPYIVLKFLIIKYRYTYLNSHSTLIATVDL